jgi:hypothetical protein
MAKFPEPPGVERLKNLTSVTKTLSAGFRVYRIFRASGAHPVYWNTFRYFGPTSARFDHHFTDPKGNPQVDKRGIMYGVVGDEAVPTCLAEVYQNARTIDRKLGSPVLCAFTLTERLFLLDLTGPFATQIGASMAINTGTRKRARRWAQQLYDAFPNVHGIYYPSSMYGNNPAIALFEGAAHALPASAVIHRQLDDPELISVIRGTAWDIRYTVI